jgi:lytic murein transglycosylase
MNARNQTVTHAHYLAFFIGQWFMVSAFAQADFGACLDSLQGRLAARGISGETFDRAAQGLTPNMKVLELQEYQPEFKIPIWDYMARLVDDQRIADGKAQLQQQSSVLAQAERRYGVDRYALVALWGVESDYGKSMGKLPLVQSLTTLVCYGRARKQDYFLGELANILKIVQRSDIPLDTLMGSWAGAFGHTQFMPSTFHRLAVDFDGDGRRDIVNSVPDALGSTANFLSRSGWRFGEPWGYEVRLPGGGAAGSRRSVGAWTAAGVTRADGQPLTGAGIARLTMPAGANGPAFLLLKNFDVLMSYNPAESYALAIAHLSDRIRGGGPLVTPWPTRDRGLSRAEIREVQNLLSQRRIYLGELDGAIGAQTRQAIKDYQIKIGMSPDGRPGGLVLEALRAGR